MEMFVKVFEIGLGESVLFVLEVVDIIEGNVV